MNNKNTKQNIDKLKKLNVGLVSGAVFCSFAYVVMLGLTAVNVVSLRSTTKLVDDAKTELSNVELGYMTDKNVIALENSNESFNLADNISYVGVKNTNDENTVAINQNR